MALDDDRKIRPTSSYTAMVKNTLYCININYRFYIFYKKEKKNVRVP